MKYHPIEDPDYFSNRDYIGKHWNRKFIRTIQAVLNSTKGKVGKGYDFFCKAFGANEEEFYKLLYMPEAMIIYRFYFEELGMTECWWRDYNNLTLEEKDQINPIIERNVFINIDETNLSPAVRRVLEYYRITRDDAEHWMKGKQISNIIFGNGKIVKFIDFEYQLEYIDIGLIDIFYVSNFLHF